VITTIELSDTDTGFSGVTPTSDDIKRYFNGWKYVDGTNWSPIGYTGDSVDAATALANLVTDIYPDADWRPWNYIYQLEEAETSAVESVNKLYYYPGDNSLNSDAEVLVPLVVDVKSSGELLNELAAWAQELAARVAALESAT